MKTFLLLCIFHTIGDFLLQTRNTAKKKETSLKHFFWHILLYSLSMAIVFLCTPFPQSLLSWLIISLSHLIIDGIRILINRKSKAPLTKLVSFCMDQVFHILFILGCCLLFIRNHPGILNQALFTLPWFGTALSYTVIFCIIWKPAEILISLVFEAISKQSETAKENQGDLRNGALIGKLERIIVVALVFLNAPTAIGFVLTAKSVARYKQLENQSFAEHYLIGTLLSVSIALAAVILIPIICPIG